MSNEKIKTELEQRVEGLQHYLESIGSALKRRSIGSNQDAMKAHERHITTVRMLRKYVRGERF